MVLLKHYKNHTKLAIPESKELASEGVFEVAVIFFFELRLQSLAICDFEVAAIRVTKVKIENSPPNPLCTTSGQKMAHLPCEIFRALLVNLYRNIPPPFTRHQSILGDKR